jgi:hypothetical protein
MAGCACACLVEGQQEAGQRHKEAEPCSTDGEVAGVTPVSLPPSGEQQTHMLAVGWQLNGYVAVTSTSIVKGQLRLLPDALRAHHASSGLRQPITSKKGPAPLEVR